MKPPDHIRLTAIECQARIGISEAERADPQTLQVDLDLALDLEPAGNSDRLDLTLDYVEVVQLVRDEVDQSRFKLLEALAHHLVLTLLALPRVEEVTLEIRKFPAQLAGQVKHTSVLIVRRNSRL